MEHFTIPFYAIFIEKWNKSNIVLEKLTSFYEFLEGFLCFSYSFKGKFKILTWYLQRKFQIITRCLRHIFPIQMSCLKGVLSRRKKAVATAAMASPPTLSYITARELTQLRPASMLAIIDVRFCPCLPFRWFGSSCIVWPLNIDRLHMRSMHLKRFLPKENILGWFWSFLIISCEVADLWVCDSLNQGCMKAFHVWTGNQGRMRDLETPFLTVAICTCMCVWVACPYCEMTSVFVMRLQNLHRYYLTTFIVYYAWSQTRGNSLSLLICNIIML